MHPMSSYQKKYNKNSMWGNDASNKNIKDFRTKEHLQKYLHLLCSNDASGALTQNVRIQMSFYI